MYDSERLLSRDLIQEDLVNQYILKKEYLSKEKRLKYVSDSLAYYKSIFLSLLPDELRYDFDKLSFIGGGAVYSLYNGNEVKDFDFFVKDKDFAKRIHKYFDDNLNDFDLKYRNGVKIGKYKGKRLIVTDNAISIGEYQIITRWIGAPEEVIGEFDFRHNQFYWCEDKIETVTDWKYLEGDKLIFNEDRARDIANCIIRMNKFLKRGFTIDNREISKLLLRLHEVGFSDIDLEIMRSKDSNRNNFGSGD